MEEYKISTLSEYISAIEVLKKHYPCGVWGNPISNHFLYRGLPNSTFKLLPSLFRKQEDEVDGKKIVNNKYRAWADEISILRAFILEVSGILSVPTNQLCQWAVYAQHYGVPTRFLDWTYNPLVALYFCCHDQIDEMDGTVWLFHGINYKKFLGAHEKQEENKLLGDIIKDLLEQKSDIEYPLLYTPYYVDARMSAQKSCFLVWGKNEAELEAQLSDEKYAMKYPDASAPERCYGVHQEEALLFKFVIPADRKQFLLRELDTVGINEKTLFPGLDGTGRYIEHKYRFNYNEALSII